MNPIKLERDTLIVDWTTPIAGVSSSEGAANGYSYRMRSDGLLHETHASVNLQQGPTITATKQKAVGLNFKGPRSGDEYTPYQISANAISQDINMTPVLFVAESIATITDDAAGDVVTDVRIIGVPHTIGAEGQTLDINTIILAKENTAARGMAIGIALIANATAITAKQMWCRLSVRRLVGVSPQVFDTTKQ